MPNLRLLRTVRALASICLLILLCAGGRAAEAQALAPQERLCDPTFQDCRADVLTYIEQETVGIDMGFWFMSDARYSNALVAAWQRGVKIRLLMDPRCSEAHRSCVTQNTQLAAAGIPMRKRLPGGILHWKVAMFAAQGQLQFAGANYSPFEMSPEIPFVNFTDEVVHFTNDPSLVHSFMTKFDDLWTSPTEFGDFANITAPLVRSYPTFQIDPELNFPPDDSYRSRALAAYAGETQKIDVAMFRITDSSHPDAMIAAVNRGVPVRVFTDETEYRNPTRLWHSYNVDRMYQAGVQVRLDAHLGINHEKAVILHGTGLSITGSSNWTAASSDSQREHNYFTRKPWISDWLKAQFERKWNNQTGYSETKPFVPLPPAVPRYAEPATASTDLPIDGVALRWDGGYWAHKYDIYFGTTPNPPLLEASRHLGPSQSSGDYKSYALPTLLPGTTYYWKIVSKTMALTTAEGLVWSFTTAGVAPPPPPPPPAPTVTLVRGPYLQQPSERSMVVVWATREAGAADVRYSTSGAWLTAPATSRLVANANTAIGYDYFQHEAHVAGLTPATSYSYQPFVSGVAAAPPASFRTAPSTGAGAVSFIAFGDSGTGSAEQRQLAGVMARDQFDLALHVGDIAYGGISGEGDATYSTYQSLLFDVYQWFPAVPFIPVEGNHDSRPSNGDGRAYLDLFSLPTNGASVARPDHAERYYSFDYGPVHFVALDTEFAFQDAARRPEQLAWLEADLSRTRQPWTVALYHRSPYSSGGEHGSDQVVRATFGPLFERYGVDLVLTGHEHAYERTVPIRASAVSTDQAVPYVVSGGGGAPLYPTATSAWTAYSASRHQYVKVVADGCTLTLDAVGLDGVVFDRSSVTRCASPPPPPPAGNVAPAVDLASPVVGGTAPAIVTLSATASDSDGTIAKVDFFAGAVLVGTAASAPYSVVWSNVAAGSYSLTAVATDNAGAATTSAPVSVTVPEAPPPPPPPPPGGLPSGWTSLDVGLTGAAGSTTFTTGTFTVTGAGADVWGTADAFHYAYRTLEGDGSIAARVASIQGGIANWVKAGVMMRGSLSPASAHGFMLVSWAKGIAFQRRLADGSSSVSTAGVRSTAPRWVKLTRTGNTIAAFESADGLAWTLVASDTFVMGGSIDVGLAVSSHLTGVNATATFDNVTVTTEASVPPPPPPPPPPVNAAPSVELTAPAGGATALAPATVLLAATAADPDGTIARVEFYAGGTSVGVATAAPYSVGVATAAPYSVTWTGVAAGTYSLTAVAVDNLGLATVSGAVSITVTAPPPPTALPAEWSNADVGTVPFAGNAAFTSGTYTVTGAGADVWGTADQFHYAYRAWTGDGTVVARVVSEQNVSNWVKAGVMIRQTLAADSPHAFMLVSPAKGTAFQRRTGAGGTTTSTPGPMAAAPRWVKLTRGGDIFTAYDSADGVIWTLVGTATIPMGTTVFAGIGVTSHNPGATATATFDGVTIR